MFRYVLKFAVDIFPPVVATVIGAWIVTHYINPKQADAPKAETAAVAAPEKALVHGANGMAPRNVETVAVKPAETVPEAKPPREKAQVSTRPVVPAARSDERPRDAAEIARAALDRLRSQGPAAPVATPAVVSAPAPQPVAAPAVAAVPALPPPVVIAPQHDLPRPLFGERLTPPAEIPAASVEASAESRSLIGGIASAARTLVDVVIPR